MPARHFPSLQHRRLEGELMDEPGLGEKEHLKALAGLRRINRLTMSMQVLWREIQTFPSSSDRPLSVLDVACGGGDVLVDIALHARKQGFPVQLTGIDISPTAIKETQHNAQRAGVSIQTMEHDVLGANPLPVHDIVFCSLFLHHFNDQDAMQVLKRMSAAARQQMLVSDLVRSQTGHLMAWIGTRLLSRSQIVHTDGPLSVEAAFTVDELKTLSKSAGLETAHVQTFWPQRMLLKWSPVEVMPS